MEVIIVEDPAAIGVIGADAIEVLLARKPAAVLGWPPARRRWPSTTNWSRVTRAGRLSFGRARGFTLDEYVGLPADHPERYRTVIDTVFVSRVDFAPAPCRARTGWPPTFRLPARSTKTRSPRPAVSICRSSASAPTATSVQRAGLLARLPDPDQNLTRQTRIDNARFFDDDIEQVPTHCPDPGAGHDHGRPARDPGGDRTQQGRGRAPPWSRARSARCGRRASCSTTPCDGAARRCGRPPAATRRLLPGDLPLETGLAGHLRCC